jgi:hypothetical protein
MSVVVTAWTSTAGAQETIDPLAHAPANTEEPSESLPLEFHGFVSQGFVKSTGNNYLAKSKRGSFEFNEVGINFTKVITSRLRTGIQLFARDVGEIGNYTARFDWFYLDYRFADWFGLRAGRTKVPFGLYNEVSDIDSARVPALMPQSVYSIRNRDFLLAQTGVEFYGLVPLGGIGGIEYRAYAGTIYSDQPTNTAFRELRLDIPYLIGGRVMWETPVTGLRLGASVQQLDLDYSFVVPAGSEPNAPLLPASADFSAALWVASVEYVGDSLLLAAEFSRWTIDIDSTIPLGVPPTSTNERYYVMGSYRVSPTFTPGAYYSVFFRDTNLFSDPTKSCDRWTFRGCGRQNFQHDLAVTLRFDINPYWLVKLEGHYLRGTGDLTTALNDRVPLVNLEKNWALFIAKTTVHF